MNFVFTETDIPIHPAPLQLQDYNELPICNSVWQPGSLHYVNGSFRALHTYRTTSLVSTHPALPIGTHMFKSNKMASNTDFNTLFASSNNDCIRLTSYKLPVDQDDVVTKYKGGFLSSFEFDVKKPFNGQLVNCEKQKHRCRSALVSISNDVDKDQFLIADKSNHIRLVDLSTENIRNLCKLDERICSVCQTDLFVFANTADENEAAGSLCVISTDTGDIIHRQECSLVKRLLSTKWHPMFTVGHDDSHLYLIDSRKMDNKRVLFKDSSIELISNTNDDFTIQLATDTSIVLIDIRYSNYPLLKFGHELSSTPRFLNNTRFNKDQIYLIADQSSIVYHTVNNGQLVNTPCRLDSVRELPHNSLVYSTLQNLLCDSQASTSDHLTSASLLSGMTAVCIENKLFVLTKYENEMLQLHTLVESDVEQDSWSGGPWRLTESLPDEYLQDLILFHNAIEYLSQSDNMDTDLEIGNTLMTVVELANKRKTMPELKSTHLNAALGRLVTNSIDKCNFEVDENESINENKQIAKKTIKSLNNIAFKDLNSEYIQLYMNSWMDIIDDNDLKLKKREPE